MRLVPNWRKWYRMYSVQALLIIASLQGVVAVLNPANAVPVLSSTGLFQALTWGQFGDGLTVLVAVIGAISRVVDQGTVTETTT